MKTLRLLFCLLALGASLSVPHFSAAAPAPAEPAKASPVPPAPESAAPPTAEQVKPLILPTLPLAPLATQLGQTLQTLVGVPSSQPNANTAANTDSEDAPGITDTFANDMLDTLTTAVNTIKTDSAAFVASLSALPDFFDWLDHQSTDPRRQALWSGIGSDLLIIVGVPLLCSAAIGLMLWPLRLRLRREIPESMGRRVALSLGLLLMRLIPAVIFISSALLLLDQNETHKLQRFVVLDVIYAITIGFTLRQLLRALFSPRTDQLRLISFAKPQAVYGFRWFSAFSLIIIYAYFFVEIATAVRVPLPAIVIFQNILGLIMTTMAIIVIVQMRTHVAAILRGKKAEGPTNFSRSLRLWLARHWHSLTIAYLIISLIVTMLGIDHGVALMLRGTILTFAILVLSRLGFIALERWTTPTANSPTLVHRQLLAFLLRPSIWVVAIIAIAVTWGFRVNNLIATPSGQRITSAFVSVALTLFVLTVLYETLNSAIDRHLNRRNTDDKTPVASARARTLLPMMRNTVFILFSGVAVLTLLSAVGVNIGPLLAGAGVVGVAIGFGSQSLVKDFLTGLFIVVENTVSVGDIVKIGDFSGTVEALSIRTIRLRDIDGSLHILPFSEVSKITNMTKGFAYALVDIGVGYDSDLELVMRVLRDIGAKIQEDPIFKRVILEPIEVMGVEKLGDSSITIRARIRTRPGKQWDVRRLLLMRIQQRFAQENIDLPYPTSVSITKIVRHQPNVTPPSAPQKP